MKFVIGVFLAAFMFFSTGCAGIDPPGAQEFLSQPLGKGGLYAGMTRSQVVEKYGHPDITGVVISSDWKSPREEWVYSARYSVLPVSAGYLSEDLYLYFDGDNLTNISKVPLGQDAPEDDVQVIK